MPPRSRPLSDIFVSGWTSQRRTSQQPITPRTPHTRSGRAEEGLTDVQLDELRTHSEDENGYLAVSEQQAEPLLRSSASSSFPAGYRSLGDDHDILGGGEWWGRAQPIVERFCYLAISVIACVLLAMFTISLKWTWEDMSQPFNDGSGFQQTEFASPSEDVLAAVPSPSYAETRPPPGRVISYENYTTFPLTGLEYLQECGKIMGGFMSHAGFWIPPKHGPLDVVHHDDVTDYHLPEGGRTQVCTKTITYLLDGHVGLVADLALMAQVAGLARERGRTFFVDDTYWNRGRWSDHFQDVRGLQPGPEPGCRAPPPEELVACPRTARHWVISSRTAKYHLGHEYEENYQDPYAHEVNRQKPTFNVGLESFTQTIRPNAYNAALIRAARSEMASILSLPDFHTSLGNLDPYISVHIRRGDRKAVSWAYHKSYVPLENYAQAARDTWARLYNTSADPATAHFPSPPVTWVASDSPDALREFVAAFPSSTALFALDLSTDPDLRALAPTRPYIQGEFDMEEEEERIRLTRGMVVDLALVSGLWAWPDDVVPGAVVCTISSVVCKVSALGLGFDRAFGFDDDGDYKMGVINEERKRWVEIDNQDVVTPAWEGFGLFN
ncbi:hypothetical protein B0H21DRAFT_695748 [Amylocystis lapponica]|nr:hypothetical protein B0H21DRAFT_695748 [Amylocystis lapponica]